MPDCSIRSPHELLFRIAIARANTSSGLFAHADEAYLI